MRFFLPLCILVGCAGPVEMSVPIPPRFLTIKKEVEMALKNAREQSEQFKEVHFVVITPEQVVVYRDRNGNYELEPRRDIASYAGPLRLAEQGMSLTAAGWYGCNQTGRSVWENKGGHPSAIRIYESGTGDVLEMVLKSDKLALDRVRYLPAGIK